MNAQRKRVGMAARTGDGRRALVEAGYELIAESGFSGATTAKICTRAGVSSGTFFHHFPTKLHLVVGILEADASASQLQTSALLTLASTDAEVALKSWLGTLLEEAADPYLGGFVAALATVQGDGTLEQLLSEAASRQHHTLAAMISAGQKQGIWRLDMTADRLALWVGVISDGIFSRSIEDTKFTVAAASHEVADLLARYLEPPVKWAE